MKKYYYSKNKHCKCGKLISNDAKNCSICDDLDRKNRTKGINNPNFKDNRTNKEYFCNCGIQLSNYQAKQCASCAAKHRLENPQNHPMFGKKNPKQSKVMKKIWNNKKLRKKIINKIIKNHADFSGINGPMYGKQHSNEVKSKMSLIKGGTGVPYEFNEYDRTIFSESLKESIRKRDNYECQNCGMTEEEHLIVIGTNLHIHHIDYDKKNCNEDNLITTCLSCNSRANMNRSYWQEVYTNKILK